LSDVLAICLKYLPSAVRNNIVSCACQSQQPA